MSQPGSSARNDVFFMIISAGIFAYFGFAQSWAHQMTAPPPPATPQLLPMVVLLKWSLRGGAIAFGLAALISLTGSALGPVLYAVAGLVTALCFIAVAIWEWTNPNNYYSGVPAILLVIFALWNGYGSWASLAAMAAARRAAAPDGPPGEPPDGLPDAETHHRR